MDLVSEINVYIIIFISLSNFLMDNKCLYITFTVSTFSVKLNSLPYCTIICSLSF